MTDNIFVTLLKKHTDIDTSFIDTFFKQFRIGGELEFNIKDKDIATYVNVDVRTLRERLRNKYSKNKNFIKNVDYIIAKSGRGNTRTYMVNYQCFERLAMSGESSKSETVRMYFIKMREFLTEHQHTIYQAIENTSDIARYSGFEAIYFFAIDARHPNMFKVGRTTDIVKRLRNYNVGRIKEIDLKYFAVVKNAIVIEKCLKHKLHNHQVFEGKEIYEVNPNVLKKVIDECYCKYISAAKNRELYKELSDLLGMYAYTKGKVHIKPFVVIGKDINIGFKN